MMWIGFEFRKRRTSFRVSPQGCNPNLCFPENTGRIQGAAILAAGQPGSLPGLARYLLPAPLVNNNELTSAGLADSATTHPPVGLVEPLAKPIAVRFGIRHRIRMNRKVMGFAIAQPALQRIVAAASNHRRNSPVSIS
jgi:hypothetical protein